MWSTVLLIAVFVVVCVFIFRQPVLRLMRRLQRLMRQTHRRHSEPSKVAREFIHVANDTFETVQNAQEHAIIDIAPLVTVYEDFANQALNQNTDLFLNLRVDGFANNLMDVFNIDVNQKNLNSYISLDDAKPKTGETKQDTIDRVINQSITHTSDSQNVHDHETQSDIRNIASRLNINRTSNVVPDEILNYILVCEYGADKKNKAIQALDTIRDHGINIVAVNATEQQILSAVWNRAHEPINADNAENIRMAIVDALASCIENERPVCSTGRSTRILASLCLLDKDPTMSQLGTAESYKNDILAEAHTMFNDTIKEACESPDVELKLLGTSFNDSNVDVSGVTEQTKQRFIEIYESKLNILSNKYKSHLTPKLRTELMSVVTGVM